MLILIDLDGTLVNTVYPDWKSFKDGMENYERYGFPERVPVFPGAKEFIELRKSVIILLSFQIRTQNM